MEGQVNGTTCIAEISCYVQQKGEESEGRGEEQDEATDKTRRGRGSLKLASTYFLRIRVVACRRREERENLAPEEYTALYPKQAERRTNEQTNNRTSQKANTTHKRTS